MDSLSRILPDAILRFVAPIYRRTRSVLYAFGDRHGLIGPDTIYRDEYYRKRKDDPFRSDSEAVSKAIDEEFEPSSVIDFGCAIGNHLEWFHEKGVEVHGIDGNSTAIEHALIPEQFLEQHDLRHVYEPDRQYDLVMCFETAEHVPERFDDNLVESLVAADDTIVFTAAPPGQSGTHHVNLKPRSYWKRKFASEGMTYDDNAVERLQSAIEVERTCWIPENLFVFRRE